MESLEVLNTATDPTATKLDVGTQVAEGTTRLATMGLGAKGGAAVMAPLGPIGAGAGAIVGGAAGYFAPNALFIFLLTSYRLVLYYSV